MLALAEGETVGDGGARGKKGWACQRIDRPPLFFRINFPLPPSSGRGDAVPAGCPVTEMHG
jgi:hypothetical protein